MRTIAILFLLFVAPPAFAQWRPMSDENLSLLTIAVGFQACAEEATKEIIEAWPYPNLELDQMNQRIWMGVYGSCDLMLGKDELQRAKENLEGDDGQAVAFIIGVAAAARSHVLMRIMDEINDREAVAKAMLD